MGAHRGWILYKHIYIESEVLELPVTHTILERFPAADIVHCSRYGEIFNRKSQDFRLQKQQPSLILARKHARHVLAAPPGYGVGGRHNYYFSVMLNCLYDCRYCFLQGMYRSANHVVFVNYADFASSIRNAVSSHDESDEVWFFSGYDCDSLAMEPTIGMADYFIDQFESLDNAWLELRTKSTQIRTLLNRRPAPNVVSAFSMTPDRISTQLENKVPQVAKRIAAMVRLQEKGWKVGLRFDPLIYVPDYRQQYRDLFDQIFSRLDADLIHSVSVGAFRLPKDFYRALERMYPDDQFVAQPFVLHDAMVSYPDEIENDMKDFCLDELGNHIDDARLHVAQISAETCS